MLIRDFGARAQECIALARHAKSAHDRDLFITMARAWCGQVQSEEARAHGGLDQRLAMARRHTARH